MELLKKFDAQNYKDTTSVFEKYTIRGIIVRDGKIAMQCSKEGEYKIPGGGMEAGETYVEALAREVKEETGLFIIPEKAVGLGEILEVRKDIFDIQKNLSVIPFSIIVRRRGGNTDSSDKERDRKRILLKMGDTAGNLRHEYCDGKRSVDHP